MANNGRFEAMALLLASGFSIKSAARKIQLSERQGYRIAASNEMKTRVSQIRSEITSTAVGVLTQGATKAAATLTSLLDPSNDPGVRLNAAKAILTNLGPLSELAELRDRLDRLEQASALRVVS
jgi:hypothetical protein